MIALLSPEQAFHVLPSVNLTVTVSLPPTRLFLLLPRLPALLIYHGPVSQSWRYRDDVDSTVEKNSQRLLPSPNALVVCLLQGHAGSKALHQQHHAVLNCRCQLMHTARKNVEGKFLKHYKYSNTKVLPLHPFNGLFSRTTLVSRYQKGKPVWI